MGTSARVIREEGQDHPQQAEKMFFPPPFFRCCGSIKLVSREKNGPASSFQEGVLFIFRPLNNDSAGRSNVTIINNAGSCKFTVDIGTHELYRLTIVGSPAM